MPAANDGHKDADNEAMLDLVRAALTTDQGMQRTADAIHDVTSGYAGSNRENAFARLWAGVEVVLTASLKDAWFLSGAMAALVAFIFYAVR